MPLWFRIAGFAFACVVAWLIYLPFPNMWDVRVQWGDTSFFLFNPPNSLIWTEVHNLIGVRAQYADAVRNFAEWSGFGVRPPDLRIFTDMSTLAWIPVAFFVLWLAEKIWDRIARLVVPDEH